MKNFELNKFSEFIVINFYVGRDRCVVKRKKYYKLEHQIKIPHVVDRPLQKKLEAELDYDQALQPTRGGLGVRNQLFSIDALWQLLRDIFDQLGFFRGQRFSSFGRNELSRIFDDKLHPIPLPSERNFRRIGKIDAYNNIPFVPT